MQPSTYKKIGNSWAIKTVSGFRGILERWELNNPNTPKVSPIVALRVGVVKPTIDFSLVLVYNANT